jgi:hypothetical protein
MKKRTWSKCIIHVFIYFTIHDLFNDAVIRSDYTSIAYNDRIINEQQIWKDMKGRIYGILNDGTIPTFVWRNWE